MNPGLYDIVTHQNADAWFRATQRRFNDHILQPMLSAHIDHCYAHGTLPLPPLDLNHRSGWLRTEPWYRGDLT